MKIAALPSSSVKDRSKAIKLGAIFISAILLVLPFSFRLDGKVHADWQQFLGRFHPLIVHVPIGLILLVPVLEIAGRFRPALREAASFVLSLSVLSCFVAVTFGYLLAYGSGTTGLSMTRHMWGGIALSLAVLACWFIRPVWASGTSTGVIVNAYPVSLVCVLLLLSWAAHMGGSLTHGDNYLFEYLPKSLKHLTGLGPLQPKIVPAADSVYARHIHPVLDSHCAACHGGKKVKGGLRVDSYDSLLKGGRGGPVILPNKPDLSVLLQRVTLPNSHPKFMPADGKPALKSQDITLIRAWITQGASPTAKTLSGISLPDVITNTPLPQVADYSRMVQNMQQLAKSQGVTLTQVSTNPGDGLVLNTVDVAPAFNDAQLEKFATFAPYIVEVELGRTSITDASFATLAKFSHLRALHLEGTAISGSGLAKLTQLPELNYLNLSGTNVTSAAIVPLQSLKTLRHLYLFNTPAQPLAPSTASSSLRRKS